MGNKEQDNFLQKVYLMRKWQKRYKKERSSMVELKCVDFEKEVDLLLEELYPCEPEQEPFNLFFHENRD